MNRSFLLRGMWKAVVLLLVVSVAVGAPLYSIPPAVRASGTKSLPQDSGQDSKAQVMGFDTTQLSRYSPSGKEVNKSSNPLGPNTLSLNRVRQLVIARNVGSTIEQKAYKNPLGTSSLNTSSPVTPYPHFGAAWNSAEKAITPADLDGNGTQEVVTVGLFLKTGVTADLKVMVTDYNSLKTMGSGSFAVRIPNAREFSVASAVGYPLAAIEPIVRVTAGDYDRDGKDEVAVAVGKKLYILKLTMTSCRILSSYTFGETTSLAAVHSLYYPTYDLASQDANNDGYTDLLVAMGYKDPWGTPASKLLIYSGTDLSKPAANINLKPKLGSYSTAYVSPSVDVGDVFGTGTKVIAVGGKLAAGNVLLLQHIAFSPKTERYDSESTINARYYVLTEAIPSVASYGVGMRCAALDGPIGAPEYLMIGGYIYKYNKSTDEFEKQSVYSAVNNSGKNANSEEKSQGSITNVNVDRDKTFILDALVGNFNGNTTGKEQIILLHYNAWHGDSYLYITWCGKDTDNRIKSYLTEQNKGNQTIRPAIGAPDIYNDCTRLVFKPEKSTFVFTDPVVVAVLGATPYYEEILDADESYENALASCSTEYGTGTEKETAMSHEVELETEVTFGFEQKANLIIEIAETSLEMSLKQSYTYSYAETKTISRAVSYANGYETDAVVVCVVPCDLYFYDAYAPDGKMSEMVMSIPYSPMTIMKDVADYNASAKAINAKAATSDDYVPVISEDVLKHTPGDPRTYPQSSKKLGNIAGKEVLLGVGDENNLIATGTGYNWTEQSIETSTGKSHGFDYSIGVGLSVTAGVLGFKLGQSTSLGYKFGMTFSSTEQTTRSGAVASLPKGYETYSFSWCLAAYNYDLTAGNKTQQCTVLNYIVKPVGEFPPRQPKNLRIVPLSRGVDSVGLQWDKVQDATGYYLYRLTSPDMASIDKIITIDRAVTSYTDTGLKPAQRYYYALVAYASKTSLPSEIVPLDPVSLGGMRIKTQPKLSYDSGDILDLSGLELELQYDVPMLNWRVVNRILVPFVDQGRAVKTLKYSELTSDFSVSMKDGTPLTLDHSGKKITITHKPYSKAAETNPLSVRAPESYDLTLGVSFDVGATKSVKALAPAQPLVANITLKNNRNTPQQALVIFALYSDRGTMKDMTFLTQMIAEKATVTMSQRLMLPSQVNGYVAKVFVWDGFSLVSTTQTPKSATVQIPE